MKLHLAQQAGQNLFTAYGDGYLVVNQQRYERSLIVLPNQLIDDWAPRQLEQMVESDFAFLASLEAEIVLLGTGVRQHFPHPRLTTPLTQARIGFEVMDSYAAARTYNILMGEGRHVAAAVLL